MRMIAQLLVVFSATFSSAVFVAAGNFDPDIRWTCGDEIVSVFVRTAQPFEGLVRSRTDYSDDARCQVFGIGTNVAVLKLQLTSGFCGVVYNEENRSYSVTVDVHSHPALIVDGDKSVIITCRAETNQTEQLKQNDEGNFQLRVLSSRLPTRAVRFTQPYTLQVRSLPPRRISAAEFFVGECSAHPVGGNVSVQLTDSAGCSLYKSIMGSFRRRETVEEADVPSMFRFPDAKQIQISCVVNRCSRQCENRKCDGDKSVSALLDQTTSSVESEDVEKVFTILDVDDDHVGIARSNDIESTPLPLTTAPTLSTSSPKKLIVRADDPMPSAAEVQPHGCASQFDVDVLYYLCIFLAVCSIVGFSLNLILCIILRRRSTKTKQTHTLGSSSQPDFWIIESGKVPDNIYCHGRQETTTTYEPERQHQRRPLPCVEYGIPPSVHSSSSSDGRSSNFYRRNIENHRPEVRHSNSTFLTDSTTMETDIDSTSNSNQTSTYH